MYSRDFILRMIEMLGELIAGILGLIKKGKLQEASEKIEHAYHDFLKEDAAFFRTIPADELTKTLLKEHDYTAGHLEILAELFCAEGELQAANNNIKSAREYFHKALKLYEYIIEDANAFSFKQQGRIPYLKERLESLN